jgi:hypothetical protein
MPCGSSNGLATSLGAVNYVCAVRNLYDLVKIDVCFAFYNVCLQAMGNSTTRQSDES